MLIIAEHESENNAVIELAKRQGGRAIMREDAYSVLYWSYEDYIANGHFTSKENALEKMRQNERMLRDATTQYGNELLSEID